MNKVYFTKSLLALALAGVSSVCAAQLQISRVTVNSFGEELNGKIDSSPRVSDSGDVMIRSYATNLVAHEVVAEQYNLFLKHQPTGAIEQINVATDGSPGNAHAMALGMSADGNYVVFSSAATNLVSQTLDYTGQVYLRDRVKNETILVSLGTDGRGGDGYSTDADVSDDGNFVVFRSSSTNLTAEPTNTNMSVFLYDRTANTTTLVSKTAAGFEPNGNSLQPQISGNGQMISYVSYATNLDSRDTDTKTDIYAYDRIKDSTELVTVSSDGLGSGNNSSGAMSMSYDGKLIAYHTYASNIFANDYNAQFDIGLRDLNQQTTTRISVTHDASEADKGSSFPSITADGRYIAYRSQATNLVENDTNGYTDGFVLDRQTGALKLASVGYTAELPNDYHVSQIPYLSANGRYFTFDSRASNMVLDDPNTSIDFFLVDYDTKPTIAITAPGDQTIFVEDQLISFVGTAQDQQDGDLSAAISWSSDIDGPLSASTLLSVGSHIITATVTDSGGYTVQATIALTIEPKPPEYCVASGSNASMEWIDQVEIGEYQAISGSNGGYLDNTSGEPIVLSKGETTLKLTPGFSGSRYREYWRIWIDLNQDGVFASDEKLYQGRSKRPLRSSFEIDSLALSGQTRMRVAMKYGSYPAACGNFTDGEVEDYTVDIQP